MSFEFALIFGIIVFVLALIMWGNYFKNESKSSSGTVRCPNCGARASVHGSTWQCGWCGDCGTVRRRSGGNAAKKTKETDTVFRIQNMADNEKSAFAAKILTDVAEGLKSGNITVTVDSSETDDDDE